MPNFGAAAGGANLGLQQAQTLETQRFALEQARQQAAQRQAAQADDAEGAMALRRLLARTFGPQSAGGVPPRPPMPGQASVPMQQPGQGGQGQPAPALPPYRPLQRDGQPSAGATQPPAGQPQQFSLAPKPPRPQLDMEAVMANAPQRPGAYEAYMRLAQPYLSAQDKQEMEQMKLVQRTTQLQNNFLIAQQRLADAVTPEERRAAREDLNRHRMEMEDISREGLGIKKEAAGDKKEKKNEKHQQYLDAKAEELQLIGELRQLVATHPEVVGIRGDVTRVSELVTGKTFANDFQSKTRRLQNLIKKTEPYGPEGRVLKGELADRDVVVKGLGPWTSPQSVMSNLNDLEKYARMSGASTAAEGGRTEAPAAALAYLKAHPDAETKRHFKEKYGYLP